MMMSNRAVHSYKTLKDFVDSVRDEEHATDLLIEFIVHKDNYTELMRTFKSEAAKVDKDREFLDLFGKGIAFPFIVDRRTREELLLNQHYAHRDNTVYYEDEPEEQPTEERATQKRQSSRRQQSSRMAEEEEEEEEGMVTSMFCECYAFVFSSVPYAYAMPLSYLMCLMCMCMCLCRT
jgi:hypothetical protein